MSSEMPANNSQNSSSSWSEQSRRWNNVGRPTRPGPEDQLIMLNLASEFLQGPSPRVVVLGVTPEVVQLDWPESSSLSAFDLSADMITKIWEPHSRIVSDVTQADWKSIPIASHTANLTCGDGCLTALQGLEDCNLVLKEMARILVSGGAVILRCFIRPDHFESLETILSDVTHKRITNFGSLKWRLAMALCDPQTSTVRPRLIYNTFNELFSDGGLLQQSGWPVEVIETIDSYRTMEGVFTFPTMNQLTACMESYFQVHKVEFGNYELADRCPTIAMIPK